MNYNKLKQFYEISKILNFSRASELLYVSQSTLSKAVADLEEELGVSLFIRTKKSLILTDAGVELQRQLADFFSNEQHMISKVRLAAAAKTEPLAESLHLGIMAFHYGLLVPEMCKAFHQHYPAVQLSTRRYNKKELFKKLDNQTLDLIWAVFSMDELTDTLDYKILNEHHFSIIVRSDHPLANRESVAITELQHESFIAHGHRKNSNEFAYYFDWCKRCGVQPNITAEYDYIESVLLMVQAGSGIAILSDATPIHAFRDLISIPLENSPILYSGIFWRKDTESKAIPLLTQFYLSFLKEYLSV